MRIALDVRTAMGSLPGTKYHCSRLAQWLPIVAPEHTFLGVTLRSLRNPPKKMEQNALGLKVYPTLIPSWVANQMWNRDLRWTPEWFSTDFDLYCQTDCGVPPLAKRKPYAAFIHDLAFIRHPECYDNPQRFTGILRLVEQRATIVLADSETTKKDIAELTNIPPSRVRVIYCAVDDDPNPTETDVAAAMREYSIEKPYFISVGELGKRKNLARLVDAYALYKSRNPDSPDLLLVGRAGNAINEINTAIDRHNLRDHVRIVGYAPSHHVSPLIQGATALLYPSIYEGFGLPPLQAMRLSVPVLASNTGSIPEVSGNAFIPADPFSIEEIALGLDKLLDAPLRKDLIMLGLQQAGRYSWKDSCKKLMDAFLEVVDL